MMYGIQVLTGYVDSGSAQPGRRMGLARHPPSEALEAMPCQMILDGALGLIIWIRQYGLLSLDTAAVKFIPESSRFMHLCGFGIAMVIFVIFRLSRRNRDRSHGIELGILKNVR